MEVIDGDLGLGFRLLYKMFIVSYILKVTKVIFLIEVRTLLNETLW